MIVVEDCVAAMRAMDAGSVDAVVTDPPYGIAFMGHEWDQPGHEGSRTKQGKRSPTAFSGGDGPSPAMEVGRYDYSANEKFGEWCEAWGREALRVLRPGGHLVSFGSPRTFHWLAVGLERAGFEVRDCLSWLYGSGFPKSMDVSAAIDKAAGAERTERLGPKPGHETMTGRDNMAALREGTLSGEGGFSRPWMSDPEAVERSHWDYAPVTDEAVEWDGWGTALKPAWEPVVLARKPLQGTVAANVVAHRTGGLNVDACRIDFRDEADERESKDKNRHADFGTPAGGNQVYGDYSMVESTNYEATGRWPANVVVDQEAGALIDREAGAPVSRFFFCAKAGRAERNAGLEGFEERAAYTHNIDGRDASKPSNAMGGGERARVERGEPGIRFAANVHPTVKPVALMRWLVRLVTPPGGTVLDPFCGSGTTGVAAALEGARFVGVEREVEYAAIAQARIAFWSEHGEEALRVVAAREASAAAAAEMADSGQMAMEL